jgi:RHS repeat-associated protein
MLEGLERLEMPNVLANPLANASLNDLLPPDKTAFSPGLPLIDYGTEDLRIVSETADANLSSSFRALPPEGFSSRTFFAQADVQGPTPATGEGNGFANPLDETFTTDNPFARLANPLPAGGPTSPGDAGASIFGFVPPTSFFAAGGGANAPGIAGDLGAASPSGTSKAAASSPPVAPASTSAPTRESSVPISPSTTPTASAPGPASAPAPLTGPQTPPPTGGGGKRPFARGTDPQHLDVPQATDPVIRTNIDSFGPDVSIFSVARTRYNDGVVQSGATDLATSGFGDWGHDRSWSNVGGLAPGTYGNGWVVSQLPYLIQQNSGATVLAVTTATNVRPFNLSGGAWQEGFFLKDTLVDNTGVGEFVLMDTEGDQFRFYDYNSTTSGGTFKSFTDAAGNVTAVTAYTAGGQPAEVRHSSTVGGTTITESYLYNYLTAPDPNAGNLASVTLRRLVTGGSWATVRQVQYAYYDSVAAHGNLGDLQTATLQDGAGNVLDVNYYRYYVAGDTGGYVGGLKYAFNAAAYGRLLASQGGSFANVQAASDATVAPYADEAYQYDTQQRVTQKVVAGAGSSAATPAGLGTFTSAYTASGNAAGYNSWAVKTVETLPDGNSNTVYTNTYGEVMLRSYRDAGSGLVWNWFTKYDANGRIQLQAAPSAVTGYDDTKPDLLNNVNGSYQYLSNTAGLITTFDHYGTTTAGETTAGGVAGYWQDTKLQQGQQGTAILQASAQYFLHVGGSALVAPRATSTVYRNTDGTGAETTSSSYVWYSGTAQAQSITVSLPVIAASQNGPGTADVSTTVFDAYGRPPWGKDADGFLTYAAYDQASGAVVKAIDDVNTADTGDFTGLPSGWTTPSGGGLELITATQVDALGRTTKVTDPNGNVTYKTYNDPNHETRVYRGWNSTTNLPTGPTEDYREDRPGSYVETLTMTATPHLNGSGQPDGTEAVSGLQTLSRSYTNLAGQTVADDAYFNLSGVTYSTAAHIGTLNTNYYETTYGYDNRGRQNSTTTPTGTLYATDFDGLDRPIDDKAGTSLSNLVKTADYVYDNNALGGSTQVGDGNQTQVIAHPGGTAADRITENYYDWRDRLVASKDGVQTNENDGTHRPIVYTTYDNLDEATLLQRFDGDGVTITSSGGVPQAPSASLLRAQTAVAYDDQGRQYQSQTYSVNPTTGAVSANALTTNLWYDHRGNVLKTAVPGGLVTKTKYDGAGRPIVEYFTDGLGDATWADAGSVANNNVLEQTETAYDANGNAIQTTQRQRFDDETALGALGNPTTAPKARVYYSADYYDAADRLTASVDVGTNGGTAWTRPATAPAASDTVLVTQYAYNSAGWLDTTTDPRGLATKSFYDNLGRTTKTIEAYDGGSQTNSTNKTTEYTYDGNDHLLTVQADEPGGAFEKTQYVYGVTTASGSGLNSNDVRAAVQYPDKTTGQPSSAQQETFTVNALEEALTSTDRNGNVHSYSYDVLARLTADAVTTLGSGVDGAVRRLTAAYDAQGNPYLFTSYDAASGGNVVNQIQDAFNGLGQLITEYQSHSGAVNTSTTPSVQYAYSEMAGGMNDSRQVSMTYPNGRVLNYNYNSGLDDRISRLSSLSDNSATLEAYTYLGLDTVVKRAHPQPGVDLTYIAQTGEPNGDAGDKYTGLDRFGRVLDQRWLKMSTGVATDRFKYGYDRDGNTLYRTNEVNHNFDELYHASGAGNGYDNLNQLTGFARGVLSASQQGGTLDTVTSPTATASWGYDGLGNWASVTTNGTTQTRSANQQNQITSISGQTTPGYDANGNTTTDQTGKTFTYDAWNRLVAVKSGGVTIAAFGYDPLGQRIVQTEGGTTTDLYYSAQWQVLEERVGGAAKAQYVWSAAYVDALVERDRDPNNSGTLSERLYVQQDANYNVTALLDVNGNVVERYAEDPYGAVTVLSATWTTLAGSAYAWVYNHQGGRFDVTTGLYVFRMRDYSPALGRWFEVDPLGFGGGDVNLYRTVGGDPASAVDPSGLIQHFRNKRDFRKYREHWHAYLRQHPELGFKEKKDWFRSVSNFSAAVGDKVTFGLDRRIRQGLNFDDVVDL